MVASGRPLAPSIPRRHWLCPWLLSLLLAACGDAPQLPPLMPEARILAFGDSLTEGTGTDASGSYPTQLETLIQRSVIRSGKAGELSHQGLERLPRVLDTHQPDLLLLAHGGNDLLRKRSPEALKENLRAMVQLARTRDIPVVLVGIPKPGLLLDTAPLYRELAEEEGLVLEDQALAEILSEHRLKSDQVHPNQAGYQHLAQALARLLRERGALP